MYCTVRLLTAPRPGPVALIEIRGEVAACLRRITPGPPPATGAIARRRFANIDVGLVARPAEDLAWLMPHGGGRLVSRLLGHLQSLGCELASAPADARAAYPEAADELEARMLAAVPRLTSPLGLTLLLDQPSRWRSWDPATHPLTEIETRARRLGHLLTPPLVALLGPVNAGKSTLTNALTGRETSITADLPGTTRDYVGAMVDLGGLVVRWIDTPGERLSEDPIEAEAQRLAAELVGQADLVIAVREASAGSRPAPAGWVGDSPPAEAPDRLFVETKADLLPAGAGPPGAGVFRCSALTGAGLAELARAARERLVPQADLDWPGPWRFDPRLIAAAQGRP